MKLAFVDNLAVGGGLSRFSFLLCKSLVENHPSIQVDYFVHYENLRRTPEIANIGSRVTVQVLKSTTPPSLAGRVANKVAAKIPGVGHKGDKVMQEIEERVDKKYELAYFPAAHMMPRPNLGIPVVGTLHDFNWRYFFGRQTFTTEFVEMMDREIMNWMDKGLNACSSRDVVDEAKKLYPRTKHFPEVIHIAPVIFHSDLSDETATEILKDLQIDYPYIIFPGNFYPHKNHLNLFTAFSFLRKRPGYENWKLVLTGLNTDQVAYGVAERLGVQLLTKSGAGASYDIRGLGYQSNQAVEALIKKARLLVSPSIYEAICTPGMDAWQLGTPTAISDIPPFREHEEVWGIRSAFFDPMDPGHMAETIDKYLSDYDAAQADAVLSKRNIAVYGWDKVAKGYMKLFEEAIKEFI